MPENQIAWNSNNQRIKETVNQTNETGKTSGQRESTAKRWTLWVGMAELKTETQS